MATKNAPMVAVIMPSMNHERFVEEAVMSIFSQNYENCRVVICDDASTDGNFEKLQQLAVRYPIILLKNEVRQGIVKTLNRCFAECAEADYFYAMATDDIMQPGMIRSCIAEIEKWPDAGMLLGAHVDIDAHGGYLSTSRVSGPSREIRLESPFERFYPSFQFHRGEFTRSAYPLNEAMMGEDHYLFTFGILSNFAVIQTNIPFIFRRLHSNNASLSQAYVTSTENEWRYLPESPNKARKFQVSLRRHMLCCLELPNASKERYLPVFAAGSCSWHYLLFQASFFPPVRWIFSSLRWLIRSLRR